MIGPQEDEKPAGRRLFHGVELPSFMEFREDGSIDGWKPEPSSGDIATDFLAGELYADMAMEHALEVRNPGAITFIIASMNCKAWRREINYGGYEQGFLDRIANLAYAGSSSRTSSGGAVQ